MNAMIRILIAGVLCVVLPAGCGESPRLAGPSSSSADSGAQPADHPAPADNPHSPPPAGTFNPHASPPAGTFNPHESSPAAAAKVAADGTLNLEKFRLKAPKAWIAKEPRSSMIRILAEFALPRAAGDTADGRLTIIPAGGTVQANIDRWRDQFGDKPEHQSQEKIEVAGKTVTLVDFSGTFHDQSGGPFAPGPGVERPGYRMLAAIIDVDGELYFVKSYGPAKTMAAHADEFQTFIRSLKFP
jgi:hypothetical protein